MKRQLEKRKKKREELLRWARTLKKLNYGHLFKNHKNKLRQILYNFAEPGEDPSKDVAKIYRRFLRALGKDPDKVRKIRPFKEKEEAKRQILKLVETRPRRIKHLQYSYSGGKGIRKEGFAGPPLVRKVVRELLEEGIIKTARISRHIYIYKPEHEEFIRRLAERWKIRQKIKARRASREYRRRKKQVKI